ncbi:hypothetical protein BpHYR1_027496 [Brachionus plicatilis]|uniref:Uncharacterized protein n=1 Tax=Brachionus plicatilis TaxID=10195 RepID=A0A3M7RYK0_BRAPC|nr:hypothetical protein BpHYR1_027496 [Brachionus plicatilis]
MLANERVAQHFGESGAAEGHVSVASAERPDAFFERQQRLVDLGALHSGDAVRRRRVLAALTARQVDQRHFAVLFFALVSEDYLKDGVRAGRVRVGRCGARCADVHAVLYAAQHVLHRAQYLLAQVHHLHLVLVVFENAQLFLVVQQVVHFAAVDLEKCAIDFQLALEFAVHLFEHVSGGLAASGLAIGKAHGVAALEDVVDQRLSCVPYLVRSTLHLGKWTRHRSLLGMVITSMSFLDISFLLMGLLRTHTQMRMSCTGSVFVSRVKSSEARNSVIMLANSHAGTDVSISFSFCLFSSCGSCRKKYCNINNFSHVKKDATYFVALYFKFLFNFLSSDGPKHVLRQSFNSDRPKHFL